MKPDISIIVPFYNSEKYLERCIKHIKNQDFTNFEVILVDDGSTDNSPKICNEIVKSDPRFQYAPKENGGVSSARNLGISVARGKYLAFVDSDDFINPEYCRVLFETAEKHNIEILDFGHSYLKNKVEVFRKPAFSDNEFVTRPKLLSVLKEASANMFLYFVWARIYLASFINEKNIRFNEKSHLGSDTLFNLEAFLSASSIYSIDTPLYHYIYNDTSLTQRRYKENLLGKYETQFHARMAIQKQFPDAIGEDFNRDIARNYLHNALFMVLYNLVSFQGDRRKELETMRNSIIFDFSFQHYSSSAEISLMMKLKIFLFQRRYYRLLLLVCRS